MIQFLLSIAIAFVISTSLTPVVRNYFIKKHWVEDPKEKQKKTHNATADSPVPRGGGIPVFIGIFFSALILLPLDSHLLGILISAALTVFVGFIDDIKDISPKVRLVTNFISALIIVGVGIGIAYVSNPLGGIIDLSWPRFYFDFYGPHSIWVISDVLAIFWIIWCMNIVGWSAGVQGQLPGFVSISAFFIGLLGLRYSQDISQWPVIILAGSIAGAYLGFLPFNFHPQTIMPGYSGKSLAGLLLAVLAILSGAKLATLILLLGVPMLDAVYVIIRRVIKRQPIYLGGGHHLHHQLLKVGWTKKQVAIFYWSLSLLLGLLSLMLNSQQKMYVFIGLFLIFFSFILLLSRRT